MRRSKPVKLNGMMWNRLGSPWRNDVSISASDVVVTMRDGLGTGSLHHIYNITYDWMNRYASK